MERNIHTLRSGGRLHYLDRGSGDVVLFTHGIWTNHCLWEGVIDALPDTFRSIAPDWPLGSQPEPFPPAADLSPRGIVDMVCEFMEALDLRDVTLVGNDSGGGICQLLIASENPAATRVGRLVLTNSDVFDQFPPKAFQPIQNLARWAPGLVSTLVGFLMSRNDYAAFFEPTCSNPVPGDLKERILGPFKRNGEARRASLDFLVGCEPGMMLEATQFAAFRAPVLRGSSRKTAAFRVAPVLATRSPWRHVVDVRPSFTRRGVVAIRVSAACRAEADPRSPALRSSLGEGRWQAGRLVTSRAVPSGRRNPRLARPRLDLVLVPSGFQASEACRWIAAVARHPRSPARRAARATSSSDRRRLVGCERSRDDARGHAEVRRVPGAGAAGVGHRRQVVSSPARGRPPLQRVVRWATRTAGPRRPAAGADEFPDARLVEVPGANVFLPLDAPYKVAVEIATFVRGRDVRRRFSDAAER